ncbi:MAG TPA: 3-hydroxyacyl-CoA dehydrogenase family protein, partial [Vicinamibacterales bacterium]|nr:3-hydroxyacyl-CoA dehydrogenase family protein [Vicinamibacterales bacterium]
RPYYLQAMRAYAAGSASIEEIDALMRGAGFRMGPFELMDLIGLDVNLATSQSVYEQTEADRLAPSPLQRELVENGNLGRKTKRGFYDYENGPPQHDDSPPEAPVEVDDVETIAVVGGGVGEEFADLLSRAYRNVIAMESEEVFEELASDATVAIDVGDGANDRREFLLELDRVLSPESIIFADAYATDLAALASRMKHPERLVGYGVLASLADQRVVEIVDLETTSDDALELAQELFGAIGKNVLLVEDGPALVAGRIVGSIVNEAVYVVQDHIATADDVDLAMTLGTNYPKGPIAWGRAIGGDRIRRILTRLAGAEGAEFGPHRALWVLDAVEEAPGEEFPESSAGGPIDAA